MLLFPKGHIMSFFIGFLIIFPIVRVTHLRNCNQYICFKSEERTAKKKGGGGFSVFPSKLFFQKDRSQNHIHTLEFLKIFFSSMGSPNLQLQPICLNYYLKQPLEMLCKKRCSVKFRKIRRKTPVSESFFK